MYHARMVHRATIEITLRRTKEADLRLMHAFELDPHANELAGTKPRDWETFAARWAKILADRYGSATAVTPRVILADGVPVGSVNLIRITGAARASGNSAGRPTEASSCPPWPDP